MKDVDTVNTNQLLTKKYEWVIIGSNMSSRNTEVFQKYFPFFNMKFAKMPPHCHLSTSTKFLLICKFLI